MGRVLKAISKTLHWIVMSPGCRGREDLAEQMKLVLREALGPEDCFSL